MAKSPAVTKNYTPKQVAFAMRYFIPTSDTYGNAYASAKAAGYPEISAQNLPAHEFLWFEKIQQDIIGSPTDKNNLVSTAKTVLSQSLDGRDKRLAQDTAKFIAKTTPEFSDKVDVTSGGEKVNVALVRFADDDKRNSTSETV